MKILPAIVAAAALSTAVLTVPSTADAATLHYSSCTKLHKKFPHGVAKSTKAANREVADGYGRPATSKKAKKIYKANKSNLDRNHDGVACEA